MVSNVLSHAIDFMREFEATYPIGAHPKCFQTWRAAFLEHVQASDIDMSDAAVKESVRSALEFREHVHARAWEACMRGLLAPAETDRRDWNYLLEHTQVQQRTPEWYEEGRRILTASEFWKLLDTPRARSNLIVSKLPPSADALPPPPQRLACLRADMNAMDWGTCLEAVVKYVLKEQKGWVIKDLGRIRHPDVEMHVAASPDGIIVDAPANAKAEAQSGNLVEIKCPKTRVLDADAVPFDYWCQMQVQMECTDRPACEYVEMKFSLEVDTVATETVRTYAEDSPGFPLTPNQIAVIQNQETCALRYTYGFDEGPILKSEAEVCLEIMRWECLEQRHVQIPRDHDWFLGMRPLIQQFICDLEAARRGEWKPLPPLERKKRAAPAAVCAIQDSPPASPRLSGVVPSIVDSSNAAATLPTLSSSGELAPNDTICLVVDE